MYRFQSCMTPITPGFKRIQEWNIHLYYWQIHRISDTKYLYMNSCYFRVIIWRIYIVILMYMKRWGLLKHQLNHQPKRVKALSPLLSSGECLFIYILYLAHLLTFLKKVVCSQNIIIKVQSYKIMVQCSQ